MDAALSHAADSERLSEDSGRLIVEARKARRVSRYEFESAWALVKESLQGGELEVGRRATQGTGRGAETLVGHSEYEFVKTVRT